MRVVFTLLLFFQLLNAYGQEISTAKPWTYWWWMGSAVTKQDISAQLKYFQEKGLGGVHIIPIYGVKGAKDPSIPFLSEPWLNVMEFTVKEGKRLGLGVDLTTGTGWPFGGPNVPVSLAAKSARFKNGEIKVEPTKQKVKRAAPGGEGFVLDPFHSNAMQHYLQRFDSAFAQRANLPRSIYMDSYEAYGANWTDDFLNAFKARRGYDLNAQLKWLSHSVRSEAADLVKINYQQTLSELLLERYAKPWTQWSRKHGFLTRYQAHGSPGNLLDLYAASDIPETESFGTSRFKIPGLRVDPDYSIDQFGTPDPLAMKFASSAAHFTGKKLVSSETGTWLANHFKVSLSQIKPQIDELFTAGINHIFYHGTTYSPQNEAYPGWLFYASTNFGPQSHFSEQFSALNEYVEKCQSLLQQSKSDNDVLLYFPIHDLWATPAKSAGNVHLLEVHHVDRWLLDLPFGKLAGKLKDQGFAFDYVSDSQLQDLKVSGQNLISAGGATYKTILVPAVQYLPEPTLKELARLAKQGAKIVFDTQLPVRGTGYSTEKNGKNAFNELLRALIKSKNVRVTNNPEAQLIAFGAMKEELATKGLSFIRKKIAGGQSLYFISNLSDQFNEGWVKMGVGQKFEAIDPLNAKFKIAQRTNAQETEVYLVLPPGKSVFLNSTNENVATADLPKTRKEMQIEGGWTLTFLKGRPFLPKSAALTRLESWTNLPDSASYFSGTGRYSISFDVSEDIQRSQNLRFDLGDVRESASVRLNGKELGTAWCIPFQVNVEPGVLKQKDNVLEIEVTNLSANYMRLRDQQKPDWKKFEDINIVDITYKKFDASKWSPMPSGLLGPVKISYE